MDKEKETFSCERCDYTSGYKIAVIAHSRKHENEPLPVTPVEEPVVKAAELPTGVDKDGVEWVGPGEETDTGVSNRPPQAGRFS